MKLKKEEAESGAIIKYRVDLNFEPGLVVIR